MAGIGHNSKPKPTTAEIDLALREKIRKDNIRSDSTLMQRVRWELWLSRLSPRAKLVGLAVWEHADQDGANAFPSMRRLLVMVGGSYRDLVAAIDEFAQWEFAEVIEGSGKRTNEYRFMVTAQELSEHLGNDNVVVALRPNTVSSATTAVIQGRQQNTVSATTAVTLETDAESVVLPNPAVVLPSPPRSATISSIGTRASDLPDLPDLGGRSPAESALGKVAAAVAATFAAAMPAAAAHHPVEQVMDAPAECWQTPKAKMEAGTNAMHAKLQRQIWQTPSGLVEVAGAFRDELERTYPLVDLKCGLATAAVNVRPESGVVNCAQVIHRAFGFMQQDAARRQKSATSYRSQQQDRSRAALLKSEAPMQKLRPRNEVEQ